MVETALVCLRVIIYIRQRVVPTGSELRAFSGQCAKNGNNKAILTTVCSHSASYEVLEAMGNSAKGL